MARRRKSAGEVQQTRTDLQGLRVDSGVELDDAAFQEGLRQWFSRVQITGPQALQRLAIRVQNEARRLCPVDTGRLRASIQHTPGQDGRGPYVDVGTNVHYAPHVEFGTMRSAAQPYMRPALLLAARWWVTEAKGI